jgi:hypothetical protein
LRTSSWRTSQNGGSRGQQALLLLLLALALLLPLLGVSQQ